MMLLKDKAHEEGSRYTTPAIIRNFRSVTTEPTRAVSASSEIQRELELRLRDLENKLRWRQIYYWTLLILLLGQNIAMFTLLFLSHRLAIDTKAISIVATATLLETYGLVKIIVDYLVKDIEYRS